PYCVSRAAKLAVRWKSAKCKAVVIWGYTSSRLMNWRVWKSGCERSRKPALLVSENQTGSGPLTIRRSRLKKSNSGNFRIVILSSGESVSSYSTSRSATKKNPTLDQCLPTKPVVRDSENIPPKKDCENACRTKNELR